MKPESLVFCLINTTDGKPPLVTVGLHPDAWNQIKDGKQQNFDLSPIGVPFRLMIFGAESQAAALAVIQKAAASQGVPLLDETRRDWSMPEGREDK